MKKVIIYIMCMCIIGSVCSCGLKENETESELEVSENVSETDDNNKEYVNPDIIGDFSDGLAYIAKADKDNYKYGYINKKGEIIIPIEFESYDLTKPEVSFCNGLACVYKDGGYGYIDKNGNVVIPCVYYCAWDFSDGLAWVCKEENGKWGCIDTSGKVQIPFTYSAESHFKEGRAWMKDEKTEKYGCIDKNGKVVIPFIYAHVMDFSEGLAWVCKEEEGKWGCIDKNGDLKIPFIYTVPGEFSEGLAVVVRGQKRGVVNKKGDIVVPFEYDCVSGAGFYKFSGGYVTLERVTDYTKYGPKAEYDFCVIDKNGNVRDDCNYYVGDFSEGLCMFLDPDAEKYGYLDENLNVKIPAVFDNASDFHDGLALVEKGEERYYIDKKGNIALDKFFIKAKIGIVNIPSSWTDLSIRTGPSTNYQIVGGMPQGARCTVFPDKAQNGWYYVEYNGISGYAAGNRINLQ